MDIDYLITETEDKLKNQLQSIYRGLNVDDSSKTAQAAMHMGQVLINLEIVKQIREGKIKVVGIPGRWGSLEVG